MTARPWTRGLWAALLIFLPDATAAAGGPPGRFMTRVFGPVEGMPGASVRALVQAGPGVLYVGTEHGLARFDGRAFTKVRLPEAVDRTIVTALGWDGEALYGQTHRGVFRLRRGQGSVVERTGTLEVNAGFHRAGDGALYLANHVGVWKATRSGLALLARTAAGHPLRAVWAGKGVVLTGGRSGVYLLDGDALIRVGDGAVRSFVQDGEAVLVGLESGVRRLTLTPRPALGALMDIGGTCYVTDMTRLRGARLAVSCGEGVRVSSPEGVWSHMHQGNGLPTQVATRVVEDTDGQLWIGTYGHGLVRLAEPDLRLWSRREGLPSNRLTTLTPGRGGMLVATLEGAVTVDERFRITPVQGPTPPIMNLARGDTGLWQTGNQAGLVRVVDGRAETMVARTTDSYRLHRMGAPGARGQLWAVGTTEMIRLEPSRRTVPYPSPPLYAGAPDEQGRLHMVGPSGYWRFDGDALSRLAAAPARCRGGVAASLQGQPFAACEARLFERVGSAWVERAVGLLDGGPISTLLAHGEELWVATLGRVVRLQPGPLIFDRDLGLPPAPLTSGRLARMGPWLAAGTGDGLLWARQDILARPRRSLLARVVALRAAGRPLSGPEELRPGDAFLEVKLGAGTLVDANTLAYRFRLDGGSWSDAMRSDTLHLPGLSPGDHRLEFQVRGPGAGWSPSPTVLGFAVPPRWYQRRSLQALAALLLAFGVVFYFRERARRLATQVQRLQDAESFRQVFGRFVAPEVAEDALSGRLPRTGQRREVTVLFADIRGFTPLTERLEPEALVQLLNRTLTLMVRVIEEQGGVVNKFMGDAVVAIFGAPRDQPDHAARAVRAGVAMVKAMAGAHVAGDPAAEESAVRVGVGINSGEVIAGPVGADSRMEYTVIGEVVNIAARAEALTRKVGADLLATDDTVEHLQGDHELKQAGAHALKGVSRPVAMWRWDL